MLHHLFSGFPRGWSGIALLLLRAVIGIVVVVQGVICVVEPNPSPAEWFVSVMALAAGSLLLVGFLTPIVGVLAVLGSLCFEFSQPPLCTRTLFDTKLAIIFAATMLISISMLGPGAFSVDARMFGRREIFVAPPNAPTS